MPRHSFRLAVLTLGIAGSAVASSALCAQYHIQVQGQDAKALMSALAQARNHRQSFPSDTIIVDLPARIDLDQTVILSAADSGAEAAPLILRGSAQSGALLSGGASLTFSPVTDADRARHRLPQSSDTVLVAADLPDFAGINRQQLWATPNGLPELFMGGKRLSAARLPENGYWHVSAPQDTQQGQDTSVALDPSVAGVLANETDLRQAGYWKWDWSYSNTPARVTPDGQLHFQLPNYGRGTNSRYYLLNAASQLQRMGDFYYARADHRVYLLASGQAPSVVTPRLMTLMQVNGAHDIRFENLAFEYAEGAAIKVSQSSDIQFAGVTIAHTGGDGIDISGGQQNTLTDCHIYDIGLTGAVIDAGDRASLTPGKSGVSQCLIEGFGQVVPTYQPGVSLKGVGNFVISSELRDGDHAAILFAGNDHVISANLIHDVVKDTDDAGAVYGGRDWTARGTRISGNAIYNVKGTIRTYKASGVYLDDQLSGTEVADNIFDNVDTPLLVGGGRDNVIRGNVFAHFIDGPIYLDRRGLKSQAKGPVMQQLLQRLAAAPVAGGPYQKYHGLSNVLTQAPGAPVDNVISNNLVFGDKLVTTDDAATEAYIDASDNQHAQALSEGESLNAALSKVQAMHDVMTALDATRAAANALEARPW